jgi:hypothetical protein
LNHTLRRVFCGVQNFFGQRIAVVVSHPVSSCLIPCIGTSNVYTESTGTPLASFFETMPPWYAKSSPINPTTYPLGAYDPNPDKTLLSALNAHRAMHPDMVGADFTTSRTRSHDADQGDIRHEAVMARESILERNADVPWGNGANGLGDGNSPGEGIASPNGW